MNITAIFLAAMITVCGNTEPNSSGFTPKAAPVKQHQSIESITMMERYDRYLPDSNFQHFPFRNV